METSYDNLAINLKKIVINYIL